MPVDVNSQKNIGSKNKSMAGPQQHGIVTGTTPRARGKRPSSSGNGSEGAHRSRRPAFGPVRRRQRTFPSGSDGTASSRSPTVFRVHKRLLGRSRGNSRHYTACFLLQGFEFPVLPAVSQDTLGQCSSTSQAPPNDLGLAGSGFAAVR